MKFKNLITIIIVVAITVSCGTKQRTAATASTNAAANKVIKSHLAAAIEFNTLQSRLRARYEDPNQSRTIPIDLRIKKGEHIWMSARILGLTIAKVSITPDRVQFYEKLQNRSFDGDFQLISDFLGEDLNYQQLEDMLLGQAFESLTTKQYSVADNQYVFSDKSGIFEKLFALRPNDFKASQQTIIKSDEGSTLDVTYQSYQEVDGKILPEEMKVNANRKGKLTQLELEFNNVEFDQDLSFPFKIPSNSKPIDL